MRYLLLLALLPLFQPAAIAVRSEVYPVGEQLKRDPEQPNVDGLVEVSFRVDNQGKIQIIHINSTSTQLTEYVVKKLSKIKLDPQAGDDGKVITYRFVFKKQA